MITRNINDDNTLSYLFNKVKTAVLNIVDGLIKTRVAKAGDTMTGNLYLKKSSNPNIFLVNTSIDNSAETSTAAQYETIGHRDKNDQYVAYWQTGFLTDGTVETALRARRKVNGNNYDNGVSFKVAADGTRTISFSSVAAWRNALGLGNTAGVLPIANGGTGMSGTATATATISEIATAGANFTITSASYRSWGKMAMVNVNLKCTTAVTTTGETTVFTLVSGKRPAQAYNTVDNTGNRIYIATAGGCSIYRTMAVDNTFAVRTCYLLP